MSAPLKGNFPDLYSGEVAGVFIDDTGSPGLQTSSGLSPDRKSWVSVVVPRTQMPEMLTQLAGVIDELSLKTGASEFHFVDIFGRRNEFENVSIASRVGILKGFAAIFGHYRFPIHVQTLDPHNPAVEAVRTALIGQFGTTRIPHFDFSKHDHLSLFMLLIMIRDYLRHNLPGISARVFVDQGLFSHGQALRISGVFSPEFKDDLICFSDSKLVEPIQLADFAAFCLNRQQLLWHGAEAEIKERDWSFLEICTIADFNYINIPKVQTTRNHWKKGH
jgi:hypothetical protein